MFYPYSLYLKHKYGKPAYRVAVDGGFSCPHRNEDGSGGCTYCDELGATAVYHRSRESGLVHSGVSEEILPLPENRKNSLSQRKERIREQVESGLAFLRRRYNAEYFLLYFQAFTGTFAPVPELEELYSFALSLAPFSELIVSTRPDCITPGVVELLKSYQGRGFDVWVELGLQTMHDDTLNRINRGHSRDQFEKAFSLLKEAGIKVTVHLIFGLPGEGRREIMETIDYMGRIMPEGIKIHNLHIPLRTALYDEYSMGELSVPSGWRHLYYTMEALERLPRGIIINRMTCDTPDHRLGAPRTFFKKGAFLNILKKMMEKEGRYQGRCSPLM